MGWLSGEARGPSQVLLLMMTIPQWIGRENRPCRPAARARASDLGISISGTRERPIWREHPTVGTGLELEITVHSPLGNSTEAIANGWRRLSPQNAHLTNVRPQAQRTGTRVKNVQVWRYALVLSMLGKLAQGHSEYTGKPAWPA